MCVILLIMVMKLLLIGNDEWNDDNDSEMMKMKM